MCASLNHEGCWAGAGAELCSEEQLAGAHVDRSWPCPWERLFPAAGVCENSLDGLVFESLIPKAILQRYVSLLMEHRRIILSGPSGTGKTYLANRLSEYLVLREGRELAEGIIATFNVDHKSSKVSARRPAREQRPCLAWQCELCCTCKAPCLSWGKPCSKASRFTWLGVWNSRLAGVYLNT